MPPGFISCCPVLCKAAIWKGVSPGFSQILLKSMNSSGFVIFPSCWMSIVLNSILISCSENLLDSFNDA